MRPTALDVWASGSMPERRTMGQPQSFGDFWFLLEATP